MVRTLSPRRLRRALRLAGWNVLLLVAGLALVGLAGPGKRGAGLRDARWAHDGHWNPAGYQWAAEAMLEYLKRNRDVCE